MAVRKRLRDHHLGDLLDDVLDGGVNDALNLDSHGKALSFLLLELPLQVPTELLPLLRGPESPIPPFNGDNR